jgi:hypothetical protein
MKHILQSIALLVTTLFLPLAVSAAAPQGHQVTTTSGIGLLPDGWPGRLFATRNLKVTDCLRL